MEWGGLRWGDSFWQAKNATWPLATWLVRPGMLKVDLPLFDFWPVFRVHFSFTPQDVHCLRLYRGMLSRGIRIEHCQRDIPPFVVFWSFSTKRVLANAGAAGFRINE